MRYALLLSGVLGVVLSCCANVSAQGVARKKEALVEEVRNAISKGVDYLKRQQRPDGHWELGITTGVLQPGGQTCLALLALLNSLNADERARDHTIPRGLSYLRTLHPGTTYVRALQTMVYAEAGLVEDRERIKENARWLIDARLIKDNKLQGWTYTQARAATADNSNTQYALLGLHAAKNAGVEVPREVWESIRDYYTRTQQPDGGWLYTERGSPHGPGSSLTMTTAGLSGLLIAGMELNAGRETIVPGAPADKCGVYDDSGPAAKAMTWIGGKPGYHLGHFALEEKNRTFYNLYGIERAGRLSGRRFFGPHDWYREGCDYLVKEQHGDGSWHKGGAYDSWPVVSTSFALLFLSKGRTPVLISKLVHGKSRNQDDLDWNNDRYDARNLTDFASRELFKKMPLAWQAFDIRRAVDNKDGGASDESLTDATSELLQSPIVYFNGHQSPQGRFADNEKEVLRKYIENGGFILAEACCGSPTFDAGFRKLVQELWPDNDLVPLPADHAIWRAHFPVPPGSFKLEGLNMGCKTVLVYSPQDLSCLWESNKFDNGQAQLAFRLGANIIAYATGMEPPRPRLTQIEVANTRDDPNAVRRPYLKVAQLKHTGDWQPAPRAMRNLMDHLNKTAGVDVVLQTEPMQLSERLIDFKFLYMHGRGDFNYGGDGLEKLRFNLQTGGLLFADACCGSQTFDVAFRRLVKQLFPKHKLEAVPAADELFAKDLNGVALTAQNIRVRRERGGEFRGTSPLLEGVKIDGRWVVLYSKYDIGCALERHQSSDCLGYDNASALRIGSAAVMYLLRP